MSARLPNVIEWALIAAVTGLMFLLDHLRLVNLHFNLFVAVIVLVSIMIVVSTVLLERRASSKGPNRERSPREGWPEEPGDPDSDQPMER